MRVVGEHAIKHWLGVLKQVHHGLEERDAHNAEEAQLGAGHTPLGGAVHEGRDREAAAALLVPLTEELLLQLVGPSLVGARRRCQMPNVCTLHHHLHACNTPLGHCTACKC